MSESEASALLRAGAIYPRRVGLLDASGRLLFAGVKRGAFSLYFDDEPIYHFDLDGRWQRAYIDGNHFRKALNQSVDLIGRSRVPEGIALHRRAGSRIEIDALDDRVRATAIDVLVGLGERRFTTVPPPDSKAALGLDDLRDLLDRVTTWDAAAWFARMEQYVRVYGTRTRLIPPDAQNAIVLQTFGSDGSTRRPDEFALHCRDVVDFLGRRAIQASTAFLDGALSPRRPVEEILTALDTVASVFPIREDARPTRPRDLPSDQPSLSGIELFVDSSDDRGELPDLDGWRAIASRRVRRVTVSFGDPASRVELATTVAEIKQAGIAVSVILPYGLGDIEDLAPLASAVNGMPLGRGDHVYMLEESGHHPVTEAVHRQRDRLESALAPAQGVRISDYNPAKQWM